ncbi:MAG: GtrA family protein [Nocardioides sp.]|uniref:GtrA family protein n=1 Tax=Nocardioides sp. TaxID=35761 RepID=UPI003F047C9B
MSGGRGVRASGAKYVVVGLVATAVSLLVFNALVHGPWGLDVLNDSPSKAVVIANCVGMLVSFPATRLWVFDAQPGRSVLGQLIAFLVVNFATMLIPVACLQVTREWFHLHDPVSDNIAANVVGLALGNAARYVAYRRWLFSDLTPAARVRRHRARWRLWTQTRSVTQGSATGRSTAHPDAAPARVPVEG